MILLMMIICFDRKPLRCCSRRACKNRRRRDDGGFEYCQVPDAGADGLVSQSCSNVRAGAM